MAGLDTRLHLDATDVALVTELQHDGRASYLELARRTGVTEKTARVRVKRLIEQNAIKIVGLTSPAALGYEAMAIIGLRLVPQADIQEVSRLVFEIDAVDYVGLTAGRFGMIVELVAADRSELFRAMNEKLLRIPGIAQAEIFDAVELCFQCPGFGRKARRTGRSGVRVAPLSGMDAAIAASLGEDGRRSFAEIGAQVGLSESQARARVKAMLDSQQLDIVAIANPLAFGNSCLGWAAIKVAPGHRAEAIVEAASRVEGCTYIVTTLGRFDAFIELIAPSRVELQQALEAGVRNIEGVQAMETLSFYHLHYKPLVPRRTAHL